MDQFGHRLPLTRVKNGGIPIEMIVIDYDKAFAKISQYPAFSARLRWQRSLRAGDGNSCALPLAWPLVRAAGAPGIRNSCYAKGKSPAFRPEAGLKGTWDIPRKDCCLPRQI